MSTNPNSIKNSKIMMVHASGAALGCVLALALYFGVIKPSYESRREANEMSQSLNDRSRQLDEMIHRINKTKDDVELLTEQLNGAVGLQESSQLNRYVQRIVDLAEQSRCKVSEAKPGEYQSVFADYGRVPLDLKCEGKPEDIIGFLSALHDSHRDTDVVACSLATHMVGSRIMATSSLSMMWYTLPEGTIAEGNARAEKNDHAAQGGRADAGEQGQ